MTTIGVISDTHIVYPNQSLPAGLLQALYGVDLILHAGDLCSDSIIRPLADIAPLHCVCGNCDPDRLTRFMDARMVVEVEQIRIGVTHGHLGCGETTLMRARNMFLDDDVQCVVFGHSHIPLCEERNGVLMFNPGSCTQPRGQERATYGLLTVEGKTVRGKIVALRSR